MEQTLRFLGEKAILSSLRNYTCIRAYSCASRLAAAE